MLKLTIEINLNLTQGSTVRIIPKVLAHGRREFPSAEIIRFKTEKCILFLLVEYSNGEREWVPLNRVVDYHTYKVIDGKRQQGKTLILAPKQEHSRKPEEIRSMIEKVSYEPRIELFARKHTEGWDVWGNEVNKYD